MSFANLKRNRSSLDKLTKAIESTNQAAEAGSKDDNRFWQPNVDKSGNGMAIIRFLPAPSVDGEDGLPWVRIFNHGFQGPGGWLIDNCLTTLTSQCASLPPQAQAFGTPRRQPSTVSSENCSFMTGPAVRAPLCGCSNT